MVELPENINAKRMEILKAEFPEIWSEGKIDFDKLKETLGEIVDDSPDRYSFSWTGKKDSIQILQTPTKATLIPSREDSIDFDETKNLFIEGDNLEVLKLLRKSYYNSIKIIYIDPTYNVGKDKIYKDDYRDPLGAYLKSIGDMDEERNLLTSNPETSGRYHSAWLSMIYPRLLIGKQFLTDDGIILVSIDDNEAHHLKIVLNDIFGKENFLAQLVWNLGTGTQAGHFTRSHEYIIVYARDKDKLNYFDAIDDSPIMHGALKRISTLNPASEIEFPAGIEYEGDSAVFTGELGDSEKQIILSEKMVFKEGRLLEPVVLKAGWAMKNQIESWLKGEETYDTKGQKVIRFFFNSNGILWYEKERGTFHSKTVINNVAKTKDGTGELEELFGAKVFDFPKPTKLLMHLFNYLSKDGIIMDYFAGSCSTAHAVMKQNLADGGKRQYIMVQLPEKIEEDKKAFELGYRTVSELGLDRIKKSSYKLRENISANNYDLGFRVFKLAESNFKSWRGVKEQTMDDYLEELENHVDRLKEKGRPEDLIFEVALKEGYPLTAKVTKLEMEANSVYRVSDEENNFLICLDEELNQETIEQLNLEEGTLFVIRDVALTDEQVANLALQCTLKTI